ncbi:MAG TPA: DNA-3-methyladenine glycosylase [Patescibacteria group bacterium]|nr:DNA-3-methyladenine glycosylase [Patescibacteria group bacterium]
MTAVAAARQPATRVRLHRGWFDRPAAVLALDLLGARLVHRAPEGVVGGRIVEVEAYEGPEDLAAHSSRGRTARNATMFGAPGHCYVYLVYGLHHCVNVVSGPGAKPEAVLIRALEIDEGRALARARRGPRASEMRLASGPGNVGQALGIDRRLDGSDLLAGPIHLEPRTGPMPEVRSGPRVGVDYAGAWAARPLRHWIADDPHVSRR